jgi:bacteriocin biosynthesis cyclodehydratase domain-containing protein
MAPQPEYYKMKRILISRSFCNLKIDDAVVLKRGIVEIKLSGDDAVDVADIILSLTRAPGITEDELFQHFPEHDPTAIHTVVEHLLKRDFLHTSSDPPSYELDEESSSDLFYWHFGLSHREFIKRLSPTRMSIVGVNSLSVALFDLIRRDFANILTLVDHPSLSSTSEELVADSCKYASWIASGDISRQACVLACSMKGAQHDLLELNRLCLNAGVIFLPVILSAFEAHVGPLIVPGETACLECLRVRQNSNTPNYEFRRDVEHAYAASDATQPLHPAVTAITAAIAAMELSKFFGKLPFRSAGILHEVNLPRGSWHSRRVLKLPRCTACSSLNHTASVAVTKNVILPGYQ